MTALFLKVANMSISAIWLIFAVLVLRLVLKTAPKWINILLWGIVAVRLICPLSIESAFSLIPSAETVQPEIMLDWSPQIDTGFPVLNDAVNPVITESFSPDPAASANPLQILLPVCSVIWLTGIALLLFYTAISYWLLQRKVSTATLLRYNIFQSDQVSTPFVLGIFKPRIYLPYTMSKEDIIHVISHEKAHIRRRDHWWKPLGFLLLALHWFNPLIWLSYKLFCRDIELACDEMVIQNMNNNQRADYAQALLACSVDRRVTAVCPLAFGEVGIKTRIQSVMNYKKPAFWIILVSFILCAAVCICFLTNPKTKDAPTETIVSSETVTETEPFVTETVILEEKDANVVVHNTVNDLAYYMECAASRPFQYMDTGKQKAILSEYEDLLDGYTLVARESVDGKVSFIAGYFNGGVQDNPFYGRASYWIDDGIQIISRKKALDAPDMSPNQQESLEENPDDGYMIQKSTVFKHPETGFLLIQPNDISISIDYAFKRYISPNGRDYISDALSRGVSLYVPEGPHLVVSLISETWGEISEYIPLTQEQLQSILEDERHPLPSGHGFTARLFHVDEDMAWFTEFLDVSPIVLDMAVKKCGYKFATPNDIQSDIVEARLDCNWLEQPVYADKNDLALLQSILSNAEFDSIGACGYGAKLTIQMADGSELVMFKGTDGCDTIVFGSYSGYVIGDVENQQFWKIFGMDADTKERLNG